jgi:DNA-binding MarR family transcriptional regulator
MDPSAGYSEVMAKTTAAVDTASSESSRQLEAALRTLVLLGALGTRISESMTRHLRTDTFTKNIDVMILGELAVRGPLRPRDLRDALPMPAGALTRHLDRLEEGGLIARSHGRVAGDRRAIILSLTAEGRQVAWAMVLVLEEIRPGLLDTLQEVRTLLET